MKGLVIVGCLLGLTALSAQTTDSSWSYTLTWSVPADPQDTIASLTVNLVDVQDADSVEILWLKVTDPHNNPVFQDTIHIPVLCFSNAGNICSVPVPTVKSGFYRYEAKLIYRDQTETNVLVIDQSI